jgi:hypothetical protein
MTFERIVYTRNRRIMVSVSRSRRELRLHESFRDAPDEILRALGTLFSRRPKGSLERAKSEIRAFLEGRVIPPAESRPPRKPRRPPVVDRPFIERLQAEFDEVNQFYFGGRLPRVSIRLSRRMRRRNGHFSSDPLEIAISSILCRKGGAGEAEQTLRHEMIHLWQWVEGGKPGHGGDFRRWARRLGITPRATRDVCWSPTHER